MNEKRKFYWNFISLASALMLQNVVTLSVNLADNVMLGAYSEPALAGVAAVNQIQFVYQQLLLALGDGLVIFGSQYWGKHRLEPLKRIASAAMRPALLIAAALSLAVSMFPREVLLIFTRDPEIVREGMQYLNIVRFTYIFFAVTQILLATLRSTEAVKIAFRLSVMTFFVNCGINYVLIYGRFGAPEMGAAGAAVGTLAARILECAVLIIYISRCEKNLRMQWKDYLHWDRVLSVDYLKIAAPMVVVQGLWGVNTALQTAILGHMTSNAIAANSVASTLFLLVKSMAVGASSATAVIIGTAIGSGDLQRTRSYARTLQKIFVLIGIVSGLILFFIRTPILGLYDLTEGTRQMADTFLIILSVVCVGMSYQMPTNNGIIRGGGNAMFVLKMDLVSIWMIVLPLSFYMAFIAGASPAAVVCCLNADQIFKCVPAFLEVRYGKWMKKLTRE